MRQIVFTEYAKAELLSTQCPELNENSVLIKTVCTAISTGTEKANITGDTNTPGMRGKKVDNVFPRYLGYTGSGIVEKVGEKVTSVKAGDRVMCYWGAHSEYNVLPESQVLRLPKNVDFPEASLTFIATFPLAALRKTKVEVGESVMVMGLGVLGIMGVQLARICGAVPVIAVDPNPERRKLALEVGADYALDPAGENFEQSVKELTDNKGVNAIIEVTGIGSALNQALRCAAPMARVALLGCTRKPTEVDFYYDVHIPGISLYGAHTFARPKFESYPHYWTERDDCKALLKLMESKRLDLGILIQEIHKPEDAPEVYHRLVHDKNFPIGVVFDWRKNS